MNFLNKPIKWVVSCEHGGYKIPHDYLSIFKGKEDILRSHRGQDIGVKDAFNQFKQIADFWIINQQSRLLIEFNRSLHHKNLFSSLSNSLNKEQKEHLITHYYLPYRKRVEESVNAFLSEGFYVVHLSIHSFTPELNGEIRKADIGLLYDSRRKKEQEFCQLWKNSIQQVLPEYKTRINYPYLGKADGFTTHLRKKFGEPYLGIEIELNQKLEDHFPNISSLMVRALK